MGLARQLNDIATGLDSVREFPEYRDTPVILGESDPEGCAACPASTHPENAYRDGPVYAAYVVAALARTQEIAERAKAVIEGSVTWAFEFEDTPFFAGYRELATNGVAKPVLNAFRMLAMLSGRALPAESSGALPLQAILADGVRDRPDIGAVAARDGDDIRVLVWNYHDEIGTPSGSRGIHDQGLVRSWSYLSSLARRPGPLQCSPDMADSGFAAAAVAGRIPGAARTRCARNDRRSQLVTADGAVRLDFVLPRHALSLITLHASSVTQPQPHEAAQACATGGIPSNDAWGRILV